MTKTKLIPWGLNRVGFNILKPKKMWEDFEYIKAKENGVGGGFWAKPHVSPWCYGGVHPGPSIWELKSLHLNYGRRWERQKVHVAIGESQQGLRGPAGFELYSNQPTTHNPALTITKTISLFNFSYPSSLEMDKIFRYPFSLTSLSIIQCLCAWLTRAPSMLNIEKWYGTIIAYMGCARIFTGERW